MIEEETGCEVEIEPDGKIIVASPDGTAAKAKQAKTA